MLDHYTARMAGDPLVPTEQLGEGELIDHQSTFVSDLGSTLVSLVRTQALPPESLLQDGGDIQALISERHGEQRASLGWSEQALEREYEILMEAIESVVRSRTQERSEEEVDAALRILRRYVERSGEIALRCHRRSRSASE